MNDFREHELAKQEHEAAMADLRAEHRYWIKQSDDPIHEWFNLTYASWLTVPRVVMEAMPVEWQRSMVRLLEKLDDRFDWVPEGLGFTVGGRRDGRFTRLPAELCQYRRPYEDWLESIERESR